MTQATMPTHHPRQTATRKLKDAETVRDELNTTLREQGIVLPSLQVEPLAYGDVDPRPLIDLGRCSPETARRIIDVFHKARP